MWWNCQSWRYQGRNEWGGVCWWSSCYSGTDKFKCKWNIVTEVKEEGVGDDPLCVQKIHNSGDEEKNTVSDDIDIVEHKIKIYNWSNS